MPDLAIGVSHLLAFLLGALTWRAIALTEGRLFSLDNYRPNQGADAAAAKRARKRARRRRSIPVVLALILLASLILVGFGWQQAQYQRDAESRDACVSAWGREVVRALSSSRGSSRVLEQARQEREAALDDVILAVLLIRRHDPPFPEERAGRILDRKLAAFEVAKRSLDSAQRWLVQSQATNPWPELACPTK